MVKNKVINSEDVVDIEETNDVTNAGEVVEAAEIVFPDGEGYVPVTMEQVEAAERLGILAGFDPLTMTAWFNKGDQNA